MSERIGLVSYHEQWVYVVTILFTCLVTLKRKLPILMKIVVNHQVLSYLRFAMLRTPFHSLFSMHVKLHVHETTVEAKWILSL